MSNLTFPVFMAIGDGSNSATSSAPTIDKHGVHVEAGDLYLVTTNADGDMTFLDATAAAALTKKDIVRVLVGTGDKEFRLSMPLNGNTVKKAAFTPYQFPSFRREYIGYYNSTYNGDIYGLVANQEYRFQLVWKTDQRSGNGERQARFIANVATKSSSRFDFFTEIAKQYYEEGYNGNKVERQLPLRMVVTGEDTGSSLGASATVRNKSDVIRLSGSVALNKGEYIYFRVDNDSSNIYDFYEISEVIDGQTIKVSRPYTGTDNTLSSFLVKVETTPQASMKSGIGVWADDDYQEWTGENTWEYGDFEMNILQIKSGGYGDTIQELANYDTNITSVLDIGSGYWKQMYDKEWQAQGYQGVNSRFDWFDKKTNPAMITEKQFQENGIVGYKYLSILTDIYAEGSHQSTTSYPQQLDVLMPDGTSQANEDSGGAAYERFASIIKEYLNNVLDFAV